jgi:uncharacterized membrane protein
MAFLFVLFTVVLSLCVVGLLVIALATILGKMRDAWSLKKVEKDRRGETH